jgi:hypothetical protein
MDDTLIVFKPEELFEITTENPSNECAFVDWAFYSDEALTTPWTDPLNRVSQYSTQLEMIGNTADPGRVVTIWVKIYSAFDNSVFKSGKLELVWCGHDTTLTYIGTDAMILARLFQKPLSPEYWDEFQLNPYFNVESPNVPAGKCAITAASLCDDTA